MASVMIDDTSFIKLINDRRNELKHKLILPEYISETERDKIIDTELKRWINIQLEKGINDRCENT